MRFQTCTLSPSHAIGSVGWSSRSRRRPESNKINKQRRLSHDHIHVASVDAYLFCSILNFYRGWFAAVRSTAQEKCSGIFLVAPHAHASPRREKAVMRTLAVPAFSSTSIRQHFNVLHIPEMMPTLRARPPRRASRKTKVQPRHVARRLT